MKRTEIQFTGPMDGFVHQFNNAVAIQIMELGQTINVMAGVVTILGFDRKHSQAVEFATKAIQDFGMEITSISSN